MTDTSGTVGSTDTASGFRFTVDFDGDRKTDMSASSASGLNQTESEYRDGAGSLFRSVISPELPEVTFSQAVLPGDSPFYEWLVGNVSHSDGKDVAINLTDETGQVVYLTWKLINAFPALVTDPNHDATSNKATIKQLTLRGDRITIEADQS